MSDLVRAMRDMDLMYGHAMIRAHTFEHKGTIQHEHEHKLGRGAGEELRGIAVDNRRAVTAYQKALDDYDAFMVDNAATIDAMKAEYDRRREEIHASYKRRHDELLENIAKSDAQRKRIQQLEQEIRLMWWWRRSAKQAELDQLRREHRTCGWNSFADYDHAAQLRSLRDPSLTLKVERAELAEMLGIATVTSGTLYLSRAEVLRIHMIETGAWLATTKLAKQMSIFKGESHENK